MYFQGRFPISKITQVEREIGDLKFTIETGKLAGQANGSITVRYGDTVLLVTACVAPEAREGMDFLPLTIDYEEKLYAAGKIPGSFFKREGRPSQDAILTDRLTDRPLRPLFPKGFHNEIQVVITTLSTDQEVQLDILAIIGASAALSISDIPFEGPVGATRIGYIDEQLVVNPTFSQLRDSNLDIVVAGTKDAIIMVEAGAKEVSEETLIEAMKLAQETNQLSIAAQEELVASCGKPKMEIVPPETHIEIEDEAFSIIRDKLPNIPHPPEEKHQGSEEEEALRLELLENLKDKYPEDLIINAFKSILKKEMRRRILEEGIRPDGRGLKDIRHISVEVGLLPRTHGSGLFSRGMTQVLTVATLGSVGEVQKLDTLSPEEKKRYMHHYNFPGFSNGEVRRIGSPGRREIGHGALAERALVPVLPSEEDFPYTIRLVSEVLSSNGSTSMASVCGSALALMDAGVPIKSPVAGTAMGLITGDDGKFAILTDIQGVEDHLGDMDFKVAGTSQGVTALQMDIKVKGISYDILAQALKQAQEARYFILAKMVEVISQARPSVSPHAPRMHRLTIPTDKIGALIGPGGKTIRALIDEFKVTIDVDNEGTVTIGATSEDAAIKAVEHIKTITRDVEVGATYTGKVTRLTTFGAFVEILPGKDGLVRIGELSDHRIDSVEDVVTEGDKLEVMVIEIDNMGRINLSHRAILEGPSYQRNTDGDRQSTGGRFGGGPQRYPGPNRDRRPGNFGSQRDRGPN